MGTTFRAYIRVQGRGLPTLVITPAIEPEALSGELCCERVRV